MSIDLTLRWGQDRVWWEAFAAELQADCWDVEVQPSVVDDEYEVALVVGHVQVVFSAYMYVDRLSVAAQVVGMAETLDFGPLQWFKPTDLFRDSPPPTRCLERPSPGAAATRFRQTYQNCIVDLSTAVDRLVQGDVNVLPAFTEDSQ